MALALFGSYARGDYGRKSDVDLLVLVGPMRDRSFDDLGHKVAQVVIDVEVSFHLPMHLAPLVAEVASPQRLGPDLLHAIWSDGIVLFAEAAALAALQPNGLAPWVVVRFSSANVPASQAVRLSRRLHGRDGKAGILVPPAIELGRGALLAPARQAQALREALDEAGATFDVVSVWRE